MRVNKLTDYVEFQKVVNSGPEPGGSLTTVFQAYCEIYSPSAKDYQMGNLESGKTSITVIIRNSFPEYVPKISEVFVIKTGIYNGKKFNIKTVSPINDEFIKVVGESSGS